MTDLLKPILKYPGAKWRLAPWIVRYLPETTHYVEPYCGSAAVYFGLPWRPKHAVLNDLSGDIVNLFQVIREDGARLSALIEMTPWAREEYELSYRPCEESVERARRWIVRLWQAHGQTIGRRVGWKNTGVVRWESTPLSQWRQLPARLLATCDALLAAEIECRPAIEVICRHAGADVLMYADPPYVAATRKEQRLYRHEMTDADHAALLDALEAHPGPAALSGYRSALYDDRLPHWRRVETETRAEKGNTRTECLWLNPALCERLSYGPLFDLNQETA